MKTRPALFLLVLLSLLPRPAEASCSATSASDILTGQYNAYRTGANLNETVLSPSNVSAANSFGFLFSIPVSSTAIYAQPLIVHNLTINGQAYCTVIFVAGMDNSIYAFDGDNPPTAYAPYIWKTPPFGTPVSYTTSKYSGFLSSGILSAPVIDLTNGVLYFTSLAEEGSGTSGWVFRLHAIALSTGLEFFSGSPTGAVISGSVPGTGDDSVSGNVPFVASHQYQRPALLNVKGTIYVSFGFGTALTGSETTNPFHGWLFAYKSCMSGSTTCPTDPPCYSGPACALQQISVQNTTPNSHAGGIWMSARGPAWDGGSSIFAATGNACDKGGNPLNCPAQESGESVLNTANADFFSPAASWITTLDYNDMDLGSSGVLLIPPASGPATSSYLIAAGKTGSVYLLQTTALGGETASPYQTFQASGATPQCPSNLPAYNQPPLGTPANPGYCDEIHHPAYWSMGASGFLYVWAQSDILRAYAFNSSGNNLFNPTPVATFTPRTIPGNGGILAVSSHQTSNAILWSITAQSAYGGGALSAFRLWNSADSTPVLQKLWDSTGGATNFFIAQRFIQPLVSNGKVYVTTAMPDSNGNFQIFVYGLCSEQASGCAVQP